MNLQSSYLLSPTCPTYTQSSESGTVEMLRAAIAEKRTSAYIAADTVSSPNTSSAESSMRDRAATLCSFTIACAGSERRTLSVRRALFSTNPQALKNSVTARL